MMPVIGASKRKVGILTMTSDPAWKIIIIVIVVTTRYSVAHWQISE